MSAPRLDIETQDWMRAPAPRAVMAALEAARPAAARFVGGCVRNALMGEPVSDIDIATQLTPPETVAALEAAGLRAVPTGIEHGTVTAVADGVPVEVTTLRRDVSTDGRRAVVAFTEDWTEDSARRDFRFNAIYCAPDGTLFDPQGGIADARERRVVFIGDADARIAEDALRILRFFRLHALYGRGRPDRDGLLACARGKTLLDGLSGERVWAEMRKLLAAPDPAPALRWMAASEILRAALGPCGGLETAAQLSELARAHQWTPDAVLMLAALTAPETGGEDGAAHAAALAERLKMSRAERARLDRAARITCAKSAGDSFFGPENAPERLFRLYYAGADAAADEARLCWSRARASAARNGGDTHALDDAHARALGAALNWERPEFPLSGNDLMEAGFVESTDLGDALRMLEQRWVKSKFTLDKSQLMAIARTLLKDGA